MNRIPDFGPGTPASPAVKRLAWLVVLLCIVSIAMTLLMMSGRIGRNNDDAGNGDHLGGIYERYQGRIYMNIAFQGYYLVPGADPASFAPLGGVGNSSLGQDKNAVYCGSQVIAQLRPEQVRFADAGYVSDGTRAWYCSMEKDNPSYHWWQFFTRSSSEDNPEKPRGKDYRLIALNPVHVADLKVLIGAWAQDGEHVFYEGALIPGADGASLATVTLGWGHFIGRDDEHYVRDRSRVYYQGMPLPGASPASFHALEPESDQWQTLYGQDTATGQYYIGAKPFPATVDGVDSSGLHLLIADRDRAYHEIFYNAHGLWYWDYQDSALKRGCANPFHTADGAHPEPAMLTPGVWADDRNAFVLRVTEDWRTGGPRHNGDTSLAARNTQIWMLPGLARSQWSKVADLMVDGDPGRMRGTLWKAGSQLYFASDTGQNYLFNDALYLVLNLEGLKRDLASDHWYGKVFAAHDIQKLDASDSTIVCRMTSRFPSMLEFWKN